MATVSRIAICPGSFDPLTNGHVDMIARSAKLFDRLIVAVVANPSKQAWLSIGERVDMAREVVATLPGSHAIEVATFDGLLADYVRARGATAVVRGVRTVSEFADESQMALMNRHLVPDLETLFLVASPSVGHISSRLVREVAMLGGSLDGLVPGEVAARLVRRRPFDRTVQV
jgi:pantetheine-phosphate adenylyltransferase